jgi:hypothetical protein
VKLCEWAKIASWSCKQNTSRAGHPGLWISGVLAGLSLHTKELERPPPATLFLKTGYSRLTEKLKLKS